MAQRNPLSMATSKFGRVYVAERFVIDVCAEGTADQLRASEAIDSKGGGAIQYVGTSTPSAHMNERNAETYALSLIPYASMISGRVQPRSYIERTDSILEICSGVSFICAPPIGVP